MGILANITANRFVRGIVLAVVAVGVLILVGYELRNLFWTSPEVAAANTRVFICSETLKSFKVNLADISGASLPIHSPHSNKDTGFPAELCYWTADGQIKKEPTAVLLNSLIDQPEPTFCPDCGRLVVGHNPLPRPDRPPPTREEWEQQHRPALTREEMDHPQNP